MVDTQTHGYLWLIHKDMDSSVLLHKDMDSSVLLHKDMDSCVSHTETWIDVFDTQRHGYICFIHKDMDRVVKNKDQGKDEFEKQKKG